MVGNWDLLPTTRVTLEADPLQPQPSLQITAALLTLLPNKGLCVQCTVRPEKLRLWSLEQGKVYLQHQARKTGGLCSKSLKSLMVWGGEVFIGKIWTESCRVCDFLLIG